MSNNPLAEEIKSAVKLRDVMEFYGVKFNRRGFAVCPFHSEKTASITIKNEHYKCFGCGAYGDAISFVMNYCNLSFAPALRRLDSDFALGIIGDPINPEGKRRKTEADYFRKKEAEWEQKKLNDYMALTDECREMWKRLDEHEDAELRKEAERLNEFLDEHAEDMEVRGWQPAIKMNP